MNQTATPFSRAVALLGLLLVLLTMVASGMSLEAGFWQKFPPGLVLAAGLVLVIQFVSLIASGTSSLAPNLLWRFAAAFGFFVAAFNLLIVLVPTEMWEITKPIGPDAAPVPEGMIAGVDPRLRDVFDISGPFSPSLLLVIGILLVATSFIGAKVEDTNPDLEPVS